MIRLDRGWTDKTGLKKNNECIKARFRCPTVQPVQAGQQKVGGMTSSNHIKTMLDTSKTMKKPMLKSMLSKLEN